MPLVNNNSIEYTNVDSVPDSKITEHIDSVSISIDKRLLQGIWGESQDVNAYFYIKGDSIVYVEEQGEPRLLNIDGNIMTIYYSPTYNSQYRIIKLDNDSLCFTYGSSGRVIRLSRQPGDVSNL